MSENTHTNIGENEMLRVRVAQLDNELELPAYSQHGDAGMDLRARNDCHINPFQRQLMPTGIAIELPPGYAAFVHPRSGLALKQGLTVANSPGVIDSGYRGEICVALINLDPHEPVKIHRGERIAQLVVQRVETVQWEVAGRLSQTERNHGGFGSTGAGQ